MFLQTYSFLKSYYTSPAKRNSYFFYNEWNVNNKHKKLTTYLKNNAGKNDSGKIIIRTKTSVLIKQKTVKINYNLRYLCLGIITSFKFLPFKNKLLSLIYFANGAVTYYLTTNMHILFSYIYFNKYKKLKKIKLKNTYLMLFQIKKLSFVSCMEILPGRGAQYCRSSGTKSKIIKFDKETHTSLLQLPSKIKKIFSYYSFVLIDAIALSEHKKYLNAKSGYWRSFGLKPIVRGVAMNAVDHPHGGRTKSIRYPRTPWGKTNKYK